MGTDGALRVVIRRGLTKIVAITIATLLEEHLRLLDWNAGVAGIGHIERMLLVIQRTRLVLVVVLVSVPVRNPGHVVGNGVLLFLLIDTNLDQARFYSLVQAVFGIFILINNFIRF